MENCQKTIKGKSDSKIPTSTKIGTYLDKYVRNFNLGLGKL